MGARLDPRCAAAKAIVDRQRQQEILLVGGASEGQLVDLVRGRHAEETGAHKNACARCRAYETGCPSCGFDISKTAHGWMCAKQSWRILDVLPWRWRARHAPAASRAAARAPDARRAERAMPRESGDVARPAPRPTPQPQAAPRPAPHPPKPRAHASPPSPSPLALAYAALGLAPGAPEDAVRAAYRTRAQQYHPDKVAQLAPEFRELAVRKMAEINVAYARIREAARATSA